MPGEKPNAYDYWLQGRDAFHAGRPVSDAPFGSANEPWLNGYKMARKETKYRATIQARQATTTTKAKGT